MEPWSCPIDQMPVEQMLHTFAPRIGWLDIRDEQQPARSHPFVHDVRQRAAYEVREIIKEPGAIHKIILIRCRTLQCPDALSEDILDGFLHAMDRCGPAMLG